MTDETTTVMELRQLMQRFVDEREWNKFHTPKNLSMSIAIEAAELMEHFQWLEGDASRATRDSAECYQEIREELADIIAYSLSMANSLKIDIAAALEEKMVKNAAKYPAERFRGRFK